MVVLTSKQTKQTPILIYRYHTFATNVKVHSHLVFKDSMIKSPNTKLAILGPKPIYTIKILC
jgi:hypothetical protein